MHRLGVLVSVVLSAPTSGQTLVFPATNAAVEGNAHNHLPFSHTVTQYQLVTAEANGRSFVARSLSLRRNGTYTPPTAKNHSVDVELRLGGGDIKKFGREFAKNWVGSPTIVFGKKTVNLPDWTQRPQFPPAPFDLKFVFDRSYAHTGVHDLVWMITVTSRTRTVYITDSVTFGLNGGSTAVSRGTGCKTPSIGLFTASATVSYRSFGAFSSMFLSATGAPQGVPLFFLIGAQDPNLRVPGLCAPLRSNALWWIPTPRTGVFGAVSVSIMLGTFQPLWGGIKLYVQALGPDASQQGIPIAMSNGVEVTLPQLVANPSMKRIYSFSLASHGEKDPFPGGLVFRIN